MPTTAKPPKPITDPSGMSATASAKLVRTLDLGIIPPATPNLSSRDRGSASTAGCRQRHSASRAARVSLRSSETASQLSSAIPLDQPALFRRGDTRPFVDLDARDQRVIAVCRAEYRRLALLDLGP